MSRSQRYLLFFVSIAQLFLAVAFFFQWPLVVSVWPFEGTTPLTYIFVSSIFAAAAAATLWPLLTDNDAALAGVGLDYLVILAPMSVYILWLGAGRSDTGKIAYGVICAMGALFGLWLFLRARQIPLDMSIPQPLPVRWSFVIFVLALFYACARLFLQTSIIPWKLTPELSVVVGFMFLGAAAFFIYSLLKPSWANSGGQLSGFLAYDIVLIVPFLRTLPNVAPEFRTGLILYTIVVVYSALLAIYYLFINRSTRAFART